MFILLAVVTLSGLWGWLPGVTGTGLATAGGGSGQGAAPTVSSSSFPTPIRHVIIVVLENENLATVLAHGPFEEHLVHTYASASSYYAICHPSSPNYLSITSGKAWQCGTDSYHVYSTTDLGTLVDTAGLTWKAYDESMPTPCDTKNSGLYAVRHNPFVYYSDVASSASFCRSHDVNSKYFNESAASNTLPSLSFYTPNLCDDGHNYCGSGASTPAKKTAQADRWLKGWLSPLLNESSFSNSVFLITFDESGNSDAGYNGTAGGLVYLAAVSPDARAGYVLTTNASHYNLLTTTEWLLGLGRTGQNDSWTAWPPMESMF